jgi:hypothetical protein
MDGAGDPRVLENFSKIQRSHDHIRTYQGDQMKLKAAITEGAPPEVFNGFRSAEFAHDFLVHIIGAIFGADDPLNRPAEYYVQVPDRTIAVGTAHGIEVRLTGVSRANREPKVLHEALEALKRLVVDTAKRGLDGNARIQAFVVIMLDGEIPGPPGSNSYSSVLEAAPVWVNKDGIETSH